MGGDGHAQVGEAGIEILAPLFEVCDDTVVVRFKVSDNKPARRQILDERESSSAPEATAEKVLGLCSDGGVTQGPATIKCSSPSSTSPRSSERQSSSPSVRALPAALPGDLRS